MDARKNYIEIIERRLSYLQLRVSNSDSMSLFDINKHAENFYKALLNAVYNYGLDNLNAETKNAAFIDLVDKQQKKAIQITSQNDSTKIKDTIVGFLSQKDYADYELKVLLISTNLAKNYSSDLTFDGKYKFDHKNDIIDVKRLLNDINNIDDVEKIKKIKELLEKEVPPFENQSTESNEVETIMSLIEYLSLDNNRDPITEDSEVDPNNKVYKRFTEHSDFLVASYQNLFAIYSGILDESKRKSGLDGLKSLKIASYLQMESDIKLNEHNNNPKKALDALVEHFESKINKHGISGDKQAIRFYLLDELIECNVFPNPKKK